MAKVRVVSKKKIKKFISFCFVILIIGIVTSCLVYYQHNLKGVNNDDTIIPFTITEKDTFLNIASRLKKDNLIRNQLVYKIYLKINRPQKNLIIGTYPLTSKMGVKEIVQNLTNGPDNKLSNITVTIPEGLHMRKVTKILADKTGFKQGEILKTITDRAFLTTLIDEYWFLTEEILNKNIYYPLEGYLYPDTYQFSKDDTIKDIIKTMLANTAKKLEPYRSQVEKSSYSPHELLTLASVIELEAATNEDRKGVSSVFKNRLKKGMGLESDVTTYYGLKKELTESINGQVYEYTPYNTRNTSLNGKLPVGPICNPSISSLEAALNPSQTNYYYFVADTSKKVYFAKTYQEHLALIKKLKEQGKWNA